MKVADFLIEELAEHLPEGRIRVYEDRDDVNGAVHIVLIQSTGIIGTKSYLEEIAQLVLARLNYPSHVLWIEYYAEGYMGANAGIVTFETSPVFWRSQFVTILPVHVERLIGERV